MSYCFLNYVPATDGEGERPDCPDGADLCLLADLRGLGWGIFEVTVEGARPPGSPVSEELARLIESGKRYPPALALARHEVDQVFGDQRPSQSEFAQAYGAGLHAHLSKQHDSPYVVAASLRDEPGYLAKGEWYWLLGVSGQPARVSWVSDDFHIYSNDVNDFDLTGQQLKQLGSIG